MEKRTKITLILLSAFAILLIAGLIFLRIKNKSSADMTGLLSTAIIKGRVKGSDNDFQEITVNNVSLDSILELQYQSSNALSCAFYGFVGSQSTPCEPNTTAILEVPAKKLESVIISFESHNSVNTIPAALTIYFTSDMNSKIQNNNIIPSVEIAARIKDSGSEFQKSSLTVPYDSKIEFQYSTSNARTCSISKLSINCTPNTDNVLAYSDKLTSSTNFTLTADNFAESQSNSIQINVLPRPTTTTTTATTVPTTITTVVPDDNNIFNESVQTTTTSTTAPNQLDVAANTTTVITSTTTSSPEKQGTISRIIDNIFGKDKETDSTSSATGDQIGTQTTEPSKVASFFQKVFNPGKKSKTTIQTTAVSAGAPTDGQTETTSPAGEENIPAENNIFTLIKNIVGAAIALIIVAVVIVRRKRKAESSQF